MPRSPLLRALLLGLGTLGAGLGRRIGSVPYLSSLLRLAWGAGWQSKILHHCLAH